MSFETSIFKTINAHRFMAVIAISCLVNVATLSSAHAAKNIAISGYDAVAYFTLQKATPGKDSISYSWKGEMWHFVSAQHRELFMKNPEKYAPQFNGFCANGLSDGHIIEADPENWRIIEGKLYLFFSEYGRKQWSGNVKSLIQNARETLNEH